MEAVNQPDNEITDRDIVFECPACGKSLVIDKQGAGLVINCTDCGAELQVPAAEDEASGPEPASDEPLPDISTVLSDCREQMQALEAELRDLRQRRDTLEKRHALTVQGIQSLKRQMAILRASFEEIEDILRSVDAASAAETEPGS